MTQDEATKKQQWAGMDSAIAFHLIDRHADNWNETGKMMEAWRRANSPAWHDAPTEAGLWVNSTSGRVNVVIEETMHAWHDTGARWFGPLPKDTK